jgi:hypothetical protein
MSKPLLVAFIAQADITGQLWRICDDYRDSVVSPKMDQNI